MKKGMYPDCVAKARAEKNLIFSSSLNCFYQVPPPSVLYRAILQVSLNM